MGIHPQHAKGECYARFYKITYRGHLKIINGKTVHRCDANKIQRNE